MGYVLTVTLTAGETNILTGAGGSSYDITDYVRSFSVRRGRQDELQQDEAGTCTMVLDNSDRRFDPDYTAGPYYGNLREMNRLTIQVTLTGIVTYDIFEGFIEGWPQEFPNFGLDATVTIQASDLFYAMAMATFTGTLSAAASGTMLGALLNANFNLAAGYRSIDTGLSTLQAYTATDESVLSVARKLEIAENGRLFVSAGGALTFQQRSVAYTETIGLVFTDDLNGLSSTDFVGAGLNDLTFGGTPSDTVSPVAFQVEIDGVNVGSPAYDTIRWRDATTGAWDASNVQITGAAQTMNRSVTFAFGATTGHTLGARWTVYLGGIPYREITTGRNVIDVYNSIRVEASGLSPGWGSSSDATSQGRYGPRSLVRSGTLIATQAEAQDCADYLKYRYKDPKSKVQALEFIMNRRAPELAGITVLGALAYDLGTKHRVIKHPLIGSAIEQDVGLQGIEINWDAHGESSSTMRGTWTATWRLAPWDETQYWILGESILGTSTVLAY